MHFFPFFLSHLAIKPHCFSIEGINLSRDSNGNFVEAISWNSFFFFYPLFSNRDSIERPSPDGSYVFEILGITEKSKASLWRADGFSDARRVYETALSEISRLMASAILRRCFLKRDPSPSLSNDIFPSFPLIPFESIRLNSSLIEEK